jgi:uncharacterized protein YqgC (DUF456 family)
VDALVVFVVGLVMAVGVVGTVIPLVPGLPVTWAAALVYGLLEGFDTTGWLFFGLITLVFGFGMLAGIALPKRRLESVGAPRSTMLAGLALAVIGFFVVPVVGLVLGGALGVWLAERSRLGDGSAAWASTRQLLIGFGVGALAQLVAGVVMIFLWVAWLLVG